MEQESSSLPSLDSFLPGAVTQITSFIDRFESSPILTSLDHTRHLTTEAIQAPAALREISITTADNEFSELNNTAKITLDTLRTLNSEVSAYRNRPPNAWSIMISDNRSEVLASVGSRRAKFDEEMQEENRKTDEEFRKKIADVTVEKAVGARREWGNN